MNAACEMYVYELRDPDTGACRYVGVTKNPAKRYEWHLSCSSKAMRHCVFWIKQLKRAGKKPSMHLLETVPPAGGIEDRERFWIAKRKSEGCRLTNLTNGGEVRKEISEETRELQRAAARRRPVNEKAIEAMRQANLGRKLSAERRAAQSKRMKGNKYFQGKTLSPEARAKISAKRKGHVGAMRGRKHSPGAIEKMKVAAVGRKFPQDPATRAKRAAAGRGRKLSPGGLAKMIAGRQARRKNHLTEETARDAIRRVAAGESRASVARSLGVTKTTIGRLCAGKTWNSIA